ncbi:MAG: formate--tetrahydrofolate ligase, partial [Acidobacteriota bacterium]
KPLYDWKDPFETKMETIATKIYGAGDIVYTKEAERDLDEIRRLGYEDLPLCVAKTPASLSDDPGLPGRPRDFPVTVRGVILSAGAGFLVPLLGNILRMPGLPRVPQAVHMDLEDGKPVGIR